ncbi:tyrosine-type recombinase/integrase [Planctomycetota bacterium]
MEEVGKLLQMAPPQRALLYKVALETGLRANKLNSLQVGDFSPEKTTIFLNAENAKDRRAIEIPVSSNLCDLINETVKDKTEEERLFPGLIFPEQSRYISTDFKAAGISKTTRECKVDFHALRTTHVNLGLGLGFDAKTVQSLARHKSIDMTMNVYAKPHAERMRSAVEALGDCISGSVQAEK